MIKYFFLFFTFISTSFAYDAVVIVLEAPLLKEAKFSSTVLQTLRKGSRVYVPTEIGNEESLPEFVQTFDRVGNIAYIPSKYIKLISNDHREEKTPVSLAHDPTDYRLEEPISSTYPFDDTSFLRASLSLQMAPSAESSFAYNSPYNSQSFTPEAGLKLNVTRKVSFDRYDRYYFGLTGAIISSSNSINFNNGSVAKESRSVLKLGPLITYDAYKTHRFRFTLGTGFTYDYHKSAIKMVGTSGSSEERFFSGYSLSPFASMMAQMTEVFPNTDLLAGADLNMHLGYKQKSNAAIAVPELWSTEDNGEITTGFKPQAAFLLGVQVRY
jgi:hypothetical protein